jgi:hypothetical protein
MVIGVFGSRYDYFGELETFAVIVAGFLCAFAGVIFAVAALAGIWTNDDRGLGHALIGLVLGLAGLAPALLLGAAVLAFPPITDVSSDIIEPPIISLHDAGDEDRIARAAAGGIIFDDLFGLPLVRPIDEVYGAVMPVIQAQGWTIIRNIAPENGRLTAAVEVVVRTPILRLKNRASIRLTRFGRGTIVDMRSTTLRGRHDFGANIRRIHTFFEDIAAAVETVRPEVLPDRQEDEESG